MNTNKRFYYIGLIVIILLFPLSINVTAQDTNDHSMHSGHATTMSHSAHQNMTTIRETMVGKHHVVYNLIDMRERMKDMPTMENTHHLMLYIHSPPGHAVEGTKVGFLVTTPDGEKQKAMAMAMSGGYGADIKLGIKGTYRISVKVIMGDMDLRDSFEYEIK